MARKIVLKGIAFVVIAMIIAGSSWSAFADYESRLTSEATRSAYTTLIVSGGKANISGICSGSVDIRKITGTLTLQKKQSGRWVSIQTWSKNVYGHSLNLSGSRSVSRGTYRAFARFTVSTNSGSEVITRYSSEKSY